MAVSLVSYQQGSSGSDITRLEIRLNELGLYTGSFDETFGAGVDKAVRTFQQQNGLPANGVVDQATWNAIFAGQSPIFEKLKDKPTEFRSMALTGTFETSTAAPGCFGGIAGNFDGQGISFGVLQFNLGQRTLQPILQQLDRNHPNVFETVFDTGASELRQVLAKSKEEQVAWGASISDPVNPRRVIEPWRSRFRAFGAAMECQELQVKSAREYFNTGRALAKEYGLNSARGLALMIDVAVQNGSIAAGTRAKIRNDIAALPAGLQHEQLELEKMKIIARRRAEDSNAPQDVLARKMAIATGIGIVHGIGFDLERQYGLTLTPLA